MTALIEKPWEKEGIEPDKIVEAPKPVTQGKVVSHGMERIEKKAHDAYQPEPEPWDAEEPFGD